MSIISSNAYVMIWTHQCFLCGVTSCDLTIDDIHLNIAIDRISRILRTIVLFCYNCLSDEALGVCNKFLLKKKQIFSCLVDFKFVKS